MNDKNKLTGMLIGLAGATYGNGDIITPVTYPVTARRLAQCVNDGSHSEVNMCIVKALMMTGTLNLPAELLIPVVTEGEKLLKKYR